MMATRVPFRLAILWLASAAVAAEAATFTVTRTDDPAPNGCQAGDCSLREAVIAANAAANADLILLAATDYGLTRVGAGGAEIGDLDLSGTLTVRGAGALPSVIQAGHLMRVFDVPAGVALTLENLRLINGEPGAGEGGNGGCVNAEGATLQVLGTTFQGCVGSNGGAINAFNTDLVLIDSAMSGNQASFGGGIHVSVAGGATPRTFSARNVLIINNQASQNGGGLYLHGAALASELTGVLVTANTAGSVNTGGGIHIGSGGAGGGRLDLRSVTVGSNQAQRGAGLFIADARVEGQFVTLIDNVAGSQGGGVNVSSADGELLLNESVAHGNSAGSIGGAFRVGFGGMEARNVTISDNSAASGAALYAEAGASVSFNHATVADNGSGMVRINATGTLVIWSNSILSGGCSIFSGNASYASLGGNLEGPGDSCGLDHTSDLVDRTTVQLGLQALANNGGPTLTQALTGNSQARDQALPTACAQIDQRLALRLDSQCDAGAFEFGGTPFDHLFRHGFE